MSDSIREKTLARISGMFDVPLMQNNLRGLWVEAMIAELIGDEWKYTGNDWAAWDFQRADGRRLEVKQSAKRQSWGMVSTSPRFSIAVGAGHYSDATTFVPNKTGERLADIYVFAWHDGDDHRDASQWQFYVVRSDRLPKSQKSIGLAPIQKLADPVDANRLRSTVEKNS